MRITYQRTEGMSMPTMGPNQALSHYEVNSVEIKQMLLPSKCYPGNDMPSIDGAVVHYISAININPGDPFNLQSILDIFEQYKVSAHYLIDREGQPIELVPLPKEAWHAGSSRLNGRNNCNDWTIGIELMGGANFDYTAGQIATVKLMLAQFMSRYGFPVEAIGGHDQVRSSWNNRYPDKATHNKFDPGPHFPWAEVRDSLAHIAT